jgi:type II secretory pathway component PulK
MKHTKPQQAQQTKRQSADTTSPSVRRRFQKNEHGVVLVLVLIVLLSLSAMVLSQLKISTYGAMGGASLPSEYEAGLQAESALRIALAMLGADNDALSDTRKEPWALPFETQELKIQIMPCNALININDIGKERVANAVSYLLQDPRRELMLTSLKCWLDTGLLNRLPIFRRPNYSRTEPHYGPRGEALVRPEELSLVEGFQNIPVEDIRRVFTVWTEDEKINLNFASTLLVDAYFPELRPYAEELERQTQLSGLTNISQLLDITGMDAASQEYQNVIEYATIRSSVFQVLVTVKLNGCHLQKRYILERDPMQPQRKPRLVAQDELFVSLNSI